MVAVAGLFSLTRCFCHGNVVFCLPGMCLTDQVLSCWIEDQALFHAFDKIFSRRAHILFWCCDRGGLDPNNTDRNKEVFVL